MHSDNNTQCIQLTQFKLPHYDEVALVLQGGGALGSYQAGVFQGMSDAKVEPDWIVGVSIGALNAAIIAGNTAEKRVAALNGFWSEICRPKDWLDGLGAWALPQLGMHGLSRQWMSRWAAGRALTEGRPGFFAPRMLLSTAALANGTPSAVSYYDTTALKSTLLKYADFDLINDGAIRVSVGAVNVRSGNLVYFDNAKMRLRPEHFMASGALPPGFPALEIDGEYYWDGGLVSNTPLTEVLHDADHKDTLVFQVDLWSADGCIPADFLSVADRTREIQFSSRTHAISNMLDRQKHARLVKDLLQHVPEDVRKENPLFWLAQSVADGSSINIVHLAYTNKPYQGNYKEYEFSAESMEAHWASGLHDVNSAFAQPEWFAVPDREQGFVSHAVRPSEARVPDSGEAEELALEAGMSLAKDNGR